MGGSWCIRVGRPKSSVHGRTWWSASDSPNQGSGMGLFRKQPPAPAKPAERPRFGPGRRLSSDQDLQGCLANMSAVLTNHFPTPYVHMPPLFESSVIWHGEKPVIGSEQRPASAEAWSCSYGEDDIFVFVLWQLETRTEIGLFPLGGGDSSLQTPFIGQWKMADPSLSSTGMFDKGLLTLLTPEVPRHYFEHILGLAHKPVTDTTVAMIAEQVSQMFTLKGYEYISRMERNEPAATRFIDDHLWNGDLALPQKVLADLGAWNYQVVPYIQDLPSRVAGILLEPGPDGLSTADIWTRM